jgi:hypothetical protein
VIAAAAPNGVLSVSAIRNLSVGGALVSGDLPVMPSQRMSIAIYLAGTPPLHVLARALRRQVGTRKGDCALAFEGVSPEQQGVLVWAIDREQGLSSAPFVVVLSAANRRLAAIERGLSALGHEPQVVTSPLEAAAWIERGAKAVLVEEKLVEIDGWNLLQFLQENRPDVKRVVIGAAVESFRLNLALRSGLAEAVLEKPFTAPAMAQKLGVTAAPNERRKRSVRVRAR